MAIEEVDLGDSNPRISQGQALYWWIWELASISQTKVRSTKHYHVIVVVKLVTSRGTIQISLKGQERLKWKKTDWAIG